jgi:hypothetical protein
MTLRIYFGPGCCFLAASEPFPTSGLLENGKGCFREIALFPILLFSRFALRFWHIQTLPRIESAEKLSFKLTHYRSFVAGHMTP